MLQEEGDGHAALADAAGVFAGSGVGVPDGNAAQAHNIRTKGRKSILDITNYLSFFYFRLLTEWRSPRLFV
jgi:hypothetical protein